MKGTTSANGFDFDRLYEHIAVAHFKYLDMLDDRRVNKSVSISDACKAGFAVYSLKASSLLAFRPKAPAKEANLKQCFGIQKIPGDSGLKKLLDRVDSSALRGVFGRVYDYLETPKGVIDRYRYHTDHLTVSIDGVHHYASKNISCPGCLEKQHRYGSVTYSHSLLSAALVHPQRSEVFVLDNEPIVQQDGAIKNDCERNAAKRLFASLSILFRSQPVTYVLDAYPFKM